MTENKTKSTDLELIIDSANILNYIEIGNIDKLKLILCDDFEFEQFHLTCAIKKITMK